MTIRTQTTASEITGQRWYVAQTQPGKERLAREHLERQGFASFLPLIKRPLKSARKVTFANRPLFPGYIFTGFDVRHDRWRSINGTIGIMRLVSFGDHPSPVPEGFVEGLMARVGSEDHYPLEAELPDGAPVRVVGGIFDDLTGTLLSSRPQERVVVLLDLLSGPRRVQMRRNQLIGA